MAHLIFKQLSIVPSAVTLRWDVRVPDGPSLGTVKWYAQWRRYAFFPAADTLFDADCLNEISGFLQSKTQARKNERKIKSEQEPRE